jgi:hypothetical protein
MTFDVFISYSANDKTIADAACAVLESEGIRCWIAPRDIQPGTEWSAAIVSAMDQCRGMVLIFSSNANSSRQVRREVERAFNKNIPVLPVRIENVPPTESLAYFMDSVHWLDALTPPLEKHLRTLAASIKRLLNSDPQSTTASQTISPSASLPMPPLSTTGKRNRLLDRRWLLAGGATVLAGSVGGGLYLANNWPKVANSLNSTSKAPTSKETAASPVIYIESSWRAYDHLTGAYLYMKTGAHKYQQLVPYYVKMDDGRIVRWLTLGTDENTNLPLGGTVFASAFAVRPNILVTSEDAISGWKRPSEPQDGLVFELGWQGFSSGQKPEFMNFAERPELLNKLRDWRADSGAPVFETVLPRLIGPESRRFDIRAPYPPVTALAKGISKRIKAKFSTTRNGICLLEMEDVDFSLPLYSLGSEVHVGQQVTVAGYPVRVEAADPKLPTTTEARVSRIVAGGPDIGDTFQVTLSGNAWSPGGPVSDEKGYVVGVVAGSRYAGPKTVLDVIPIKYVSALLLS